ncbi:MAG TPA: hypothetical protein VGF45_10700, partial [Polyangia bacterium]
MVALVCLADVAEARVALLPAGGRPTQVLREGGLCGPLPAGWSLAADRRTVRPPAAGATAARSIEVKLAADPDDCERSRSVMGLVVTGAHPEIDPAEVVFAPDEGRLEIGGRRLKGALVAWQLPRANPTQEARTREGQEGCLAPTAGTGGRERCVVPLPR